MPQYSHNYFIDSSDVPYSGSGAGVNKTYAPRDILQETNTYATDLKCGRITEKGQPNRDKDIFSKFKLTANVFQPTAPTVVPGSLIEEALWSRIATSGHTATQDVFVAGVSRNASVLTVSPESNWSHDNPRYSVQHHWCMSSRVKHLGVVVNDGSSTTGVAYTSGTPPRMQFVLGSVRACQRHRIQLEAQAIIDQFETYAIGTGSGTQAWEVWTAEPTGVNPAATQDYTYNLGLYLGVSNYVDVTTIVGSSHTWSFSPAIDLGPGTQEIVFVPVGTFTGMSAGCTWHATSTHLHIRLLHPTGGNGMSIVPYMSNRSYPHISGDSDDTINANALGTVRQDTLPTLVFFEKYTHADMKAIVQECIDEAGYEDTHSILLTMAHKTSNTLPAAGWANGTGALGPQLKITWTPPPVIDSFTATPDSIYVGEGSVLRWETSESDLTSIDNGIGVVTADGQLIVKPTETTTYTLTAWSAAGQVTSEVTVTVDPKAAPTFTPNETSIANAALILLGEHRIDSLNEGGKTANLIAEQFVELRDQLLRYVPWGFATQRASLAADAERPAWGFGFSYTLPNNCLRLIEVDSEIRQPYRVEGRSVVTDIHPPLKIVYTAEVEDITKMDVLYRETLAAYIASELAEAITGSSEKMRQVYGIFRSRLEQAQAANGQEHSTRVAEHSEHIVSRGKVEE